MSIADAENLAEYEFNYKPADKITISDAILACNVISSFELRGNPQTEEEFNASFTNYDTENSITWSEVKAKYDELRSQTWH